MKYLRICSVVLCLSFTTSVLAEDFITVADFKNYSIDLYDGIDDNKADFVLAAINIKTNFGLDKNGYISQVSIINCPKMTKEDIYVQAVIWCQKLFDKKGKAKEIVNDRSTGNIVVERYLDDIAASNSFSIWQGTKTYKVNILTRIQIEIKDEKCRLTTQIEDYGISKTTYNAYGMSFRGKSHPCPPKENFPFELIYDGMSTKEQKKAKKQYDAYKEISAKAYVMSYIYTQIIYDKFSNFMSESVEKQINEDW